MENSSTKHSRAINWTSGNTTLLLHYPTLRKWLESTLVSPCSLFTCTRSKRTFLISNFMYWITITNSRLCYCVAISDTTNNLNRCLNEYTINTCISLCKIRSVLYIRESIEGEVQIINHVPIMQATL